MSNRSKIINKKKSKLKIQNDFMRSMIKNNAKATHILDEKFDQTQAEIISERGMVALNIDGGLQTMLGSQMLAINKLQHSCVLMANNLPYSEEKKYYLNSAIKLSNAFAQQAHLLAKLQGLVGQKILVERINISNGGKAIIGNINQTKGEG
jgi:hypothetical protein